MEQELVAPTEHPSSSPVVSGVRVPQSLSFCVVVSGSLLVLLSVWFFLPLYCLFFFNLRLVITSLVSSTFFHVFIEVPKKNNYNFAVYVSKTATIATFFCIDTVSKISLKYNFQQFIACSLVAITIWSFPHSSLMTYH